MLDFIESRIEDSKTRIEDSKTGIENSYQRIKDSKTRIKDSKLNKIIITGKRKIIVKKISKSI